MTYRDGYPNLTQTGPRTLTAAMLMALLATGCEAPAQPSTDNNKYDWSALAPGEVATMQGERSLLLEQMRDLDSGGRYADVDPAATPRIEEMPGYGIRVTPERREMIKQSTVQLAASYEDPNSPDGISWMSWCTATKVSLGGQTYILTAAHCITGSLQHPNDTDYLPDLPPAKNVTQLLKQQYRIVDPSVPLQDRLQTEPLANVEQVAIDLSGETDFALLQVTSNPKNAGLFDNIPSLDIAAMISGNTNIPLPGQEVATYSVPGSSNIGIAGTGIYLGRVDIGSDLSGISRQLDLVAIAPQNILSDGCYYGASGSSFSSGSSPSQSFISGPLTYRANTGYPAGYHDPTDPDPLYTAESLFKITRSTDVDVFAPNVVTICGYSVPTANTLLDLARAIQDPGFLGTGYVPGIPRKGA